MKLLMLTVFLVFVAVAMSADEPCNLQCEPNNLPICVKDTKTNEKETMYNYCAMLQKNQCQGGSYEQVHEGACTDTETKKA